MTILDLVYLYTILNPCPHYTLINSVDFHPQENLFCATYTHENTLIFYTLDAEGHPQIFQTLSNPSARLSHPQHAVFSPDGNKILIANWTNQTMTIYQRQKTGLFSTQPSAIIPCPPALPRHKPHGIAFSPCGNFLAVAYGAAHDHPKAVALFLLTEGTLQLIDVLQEPHLSDTPKGIAFSPDGTSLLVTFANTNSLALFDVSKTTHTITPIPRQVVRGPETKISRPEDVKISPDGTICALTNSDQNSVTFYPFDSTLNQITEQSPITILQTPLCFPHGIAFSPDGSFFLITEFGGVDTANNGNIIWDPSISPKEAKIHVYRISVL